jgi:hypothetical protein
MNRTRTCVFRIVQEALTNCQPHKAQRTPQKKPQPVTVLWMNSEGIRRLVLARHGNSPALLSFRSARSSAFSSPVHINPFKLSSDHGTKN